MPRQVTGSGNSKYENVSKWNSMVCLQNCKWLAVAGGRRKVRYEAELERGAGPKSKGTLPTRLTGLHIMPYTKSSHLVISYNSPASLLESNFNSVSPGWDLRVCISNKVCVDASTMSNRI